MTSRRDLAEDRTSAADDTVGAAVRERLARPIDEAAGLPNEAYWDPAFLSLENQRLFARTWVVAGYLHDLPRPGDCRPVTVADTPLILVHGGDGEIRAFHNACRHRGSQLIAKPSSDRQRIVCPYHAWTYGLDGTLLARPHFDGPDKHREGDPDRPELDLVSVRCSVWFDLIFVNLSGDAPPLEEHLRPMTEKMGDYDLSVLRHAGKLEFEVEANWKLALENFIENYHVFAVHPKLTQFAPIRTRGAGDFDGHCLSNHYTFPEAEAGRGAGLPHFPDLGEEAASRGLWFLMFPTLGVEFWPDQFAVFRVVPVAPDRTREQIDIYLIGEAATSETHAEARQAVFDMWRELNHEDLGILGRLQAGRRSPSFTGGVYSAFWEPCSLHFARLVAEGVR